jgi:hypothetical protein
MQTIRPGAVISRIWEIYREHTGALVGTAAVLFALEFVVLLLVTGASIAIIILFLALDVLYQGMVVVLVQDVESGRRDHSVVDLLRSVEPVLLPLIGVSILYAVGVAVGFIFFIIPGLVLLVIWSVVAPVVVLERPGVLAAFGRSRELVRGNGWSVFGVIVLVALIVGVVRLIGLVLAASVGSVGGALIDWAVTAAVAPVSALSAPVLYFALREPAAL